MLYTCYLFRQACYVTIHPRRAARFHAVEHRDSGCKNPAHGRAEAGAKRRPSSRIRLVTSGIVSNLSDFSHIALFLRPFSFLITGDVEPNYLLAGRFDEWSAGKALLDEFKQRPLRRGYPQPGSSHERYCCSSKKNHVLRYYCDIWGGDIGKTAVMSG
jgi:hypothetical protein